MTLPRRSLLTTAAVLSVSVAVPTSLAAQGALAAPASTSTTTQAPSAGTDLGLLDPIFGVVTSLTSALSTVLSGSLLTNLSSLTTSLNSGSAASSSALTPVQSLLSQLSSSISGSDPTTSALLAQVATLTQAGSGSGQLPLSYLDPIATTLGSLAGQSGLTQQQHDTLTGLQAALTSLVGAAQATDPVAGLPLGSLTLDPTQVTQLDTLLAQLQGGAPSTPALLTPVVSVLQGAAGAPGLPAPIAQVINDVATQLAGATSLTPALTTPVGQLLNQIAATPGVPALVASTLHTLSGLLLSPGTDQAGTGGTGGTSTSTSTTTSTTATGTGTNTPAAGTLAPGAGSLSPGATTGYGTTGSAPKVLVKLKSVRFTKARTALVVRLSCPTGQGACTSLLFALRGTTSVVTPVLLQLSEGATAVRTLRLDSRTRRTLRRKAVRVRVYTAASKSQISSRALTVKKIPARKRARR